jgi:hypothetical protein
VDDTLGTHPKARDAGNPAMGLWVMAGSWSSQQLTDGHVPEWFVAGFRYGPRDAAALVTTGLWTPAPGGWQFHEWDQSNPTRAQVEARRESDRKRKSPWRGDP